MAKQPLVNPQLENDFMRSFAKDVMERSNAMRGEFLSPENTLRYNHGSMFKSPANTKGGQSAGIKKHSSITEISYADIVSGNIAQIFFSAQDVSKQMTESITGEMIRVVTNATEETGNIINTKEKSIHEAFYESMEMMELPLDEDGELSMPTMMVGPEVFEKLKNAPPADDELNARLEALKKRKKEEAIEREKLRLSKFERRPH